MSFEFGHVIAQTEEAAQSDFVSREVPLGRMTLEEVDAALFECGVIINASHFSLRKKATSLRLEDGGNWSEWSAEDLAKYTFHGNLHPMLRDYSEAVVAWLRLEKAKRRKVNLIRRRLTLLLELGEPIRSHVINAIEAVQVGSI